MSVYFYVVFRAMVLSQFNLKVYDQISYLPMCGWNGVHQASPSNIFSSPQQAFPQRTMDAFAYTRTGDDNRNSLDKHNNGNTGDDDTLNDHVDRGIGGIQYDKIYILTYMSPKTAEKRQERKGGDNKEGTSTAKVDDAGDKTTKDQTIYTSSKKPASYSTYYFKTTQSEFEQTGKNDRIFSSSAAGTTPKPSLFRKRRDAIAKPGSSSSSKKDKESQQPINCSCTIKTAHNFTMSLLGVHGPQPKKLLMFIKPVVSDSGKVRTFSLNASLFWNGHYSIVPEWWQTQKMAKVTVTIEEMEKPVDPYMIVLGVSGSNDLKIQCKSRSTSTLEGTRNPLGIHKSTVNPKTTGAPKTLKNPVTPTQEKSLDQDVVEISPFFIGAVTALAVALIVMIAGLALWKRSRTNLRKANLNKTGGLMMGQHEDFYEEIPDPNRGRSSSKTRLGTLSLSLPRGQNSPVLNHRDMKKDSLERTAILTTVTTSTSLNMNIPTTTTTATSTTTTTDDQTGGSMMSTSASPSDKPVYAVYEELPEIKREAHPPPKPFLDRESLMIQRSQSTPIRYSYSSCSSNDGGDDGANQPEDNRRIKMSLSYSEDKSVRIDRDMGALLLKQYSFQHQTSATKTAKEIMDTPSTTKHEEPLQQNGQIIASSDEPDLVDDDNNNDDDDNNNNNDRDNPNNGKSSCDCGRNDPENTYMEIDCRHCHDVTANKAKTTEVNEGGISRLRKGTVVYRPERDVEFVMFDNVIYSSCDALELVSH